MRRTDSSRNLFSKIAGVAAAVLVVVLAASAWVLATVRAGSGPMAGDWVGTCQDGRAFVTVTLKPAIGGYGGTISIGNVKVTSPPAAPEGSCVVKDRASPEHAMKITKSALTGKLLTFDSEHGQEYEMKLTGANTAALRFVATTHDESWFALQRVK